MHRDMTIRRSACLDYTAYVLKSQQLQVFVVRGLATTAYELTILSSIYNVLGYISFTGCYAPHRTILDMVYHLGRGYCYSGG